MNKLNRMEEMHETCGKPNLVPTCGGSGVVLATARHTPLEVCREPSSKPQKQAREREVRDG